MKIISKEEKDIILDTLNQVFDTIGEDSTDDEVILFLGRERNRLMEENKLQKERIDNLLIELRDCYKRTDQASEEVVCKVFDEVPDDVTVVTINTKHKLANISIDLEHPDYMYETHTCDDGSRDSLSYYAE